MLTRRAVSIRGQAVVAGVIQCVRQLLARQLGAGCGHLTVDLSLL